MKKFEYLEVELGHRQTTDYLDEAGEEGWELVQIIGSVAIMKREIETETDVTVEEVLKDINAGRTKVSTRIRVMLQWSHARYLKDVTLPSRNFGAKTKQEWIELNQKYYETRTNQRASAGCLADPQDGAESRQSIRTVVP